MTDKAESFYSYCTATTRSVIEQNNAYIKELFQQMHGVEDALEQIEKEIAHTQCPFCGGQMIDISPLKDARLTIVDISNLYYFSPAEGYSHQREDGLTPEQWECQDCGVFSHKLVGKLNHHWLRNGEPPSPQSLAATVFDSIATVDEIAYTYVGYLGMFYFLSNDTWWTFGYKTKDNILDDLQIQKPQKPTRTIYRDGYIYLLKAETGHCKIGRARNVSKRTNLFEVKLPFKIQLLHTFPADDMIEAESKLHAMFSTLRCNGEWFNLAQTHIDTLSQIVEFKDGNFWKEPQ